MNDRDWSFKCIDDDTFEMSFQVSTSNKLFQKILENKLLVDKLGEKGVKYDKVKKVDNFAILADDKSAVVRAYLNAIAGGCKKQVKRVERIVKKDNVSLLSCKIYCAKYKKVKDKWIVNVYYRGVYKI